MGIFGGLLKAYGEKGTKTPYRPTKKKLESYESWQYGDVRSLFRDTPAPGFEYAGAGYTGPGLGYTPEEMEGKFGEGRDLIAGEAAGEQQRTADRFRSPGGLGLRSAQYARAQQRSDLARVARANELKRHMVVENAQQKRADKLARLAAVGMAYGQGTGLYNTYVGGFNERRRRRFEGAGEAGDAVMSGYAGGFAAGGGGAQWQGPSGGGGGWV